MKKGRDEMADLANDSMRACPACKGIGQRHADFICPGGGSGWLECSVCAGGGWLTPTRLEWWEMGIVIRSFRKHQAVTLRAAAGRLGITMTELSTLEQGRRDPSAVLDTIMSWPETLHETPGNA